MAQFFGQGVEPKEVPLEQWQKFGTAVKEKWSVGTGFPTRTATAPRRQPRSATSSSSRLTKFLSKELGR
jgi:hypothetical protein